MPEISVIVPVYNVEKYIKKCVDSILSQTFSDFELILIDDGSEDKSGVICDRYIEEDERIVVIHKENGGLSSARNAGIDISLGRYITFIDSDDYVDKDLLETLYSDLQAHNVSMSICGVYNSYKNKDYSLNNVKFYRKIDIKEAVRLMLHGKVTNVFAVAKLYDRNIFNKIRYAEEISYAEDAEIILKILNKCNGVFINSAPKYYYVRRNNSLTTSGSIEKEFLAIEIFKKIKKFIELNYPDIVDVANYRVLNTYRCIFNRNSMKKDQRINNDEKICKALRVIRKEIFSILSNKYFTYKQKMAFLLIYINPFFYNVVFRVRMKRIE